MSEFEHPNDAKYETLEQYLAAMREQEATRVSEATAALQGDITETQIEMAKPQSKEGIISPDTLAEIAKLPQEEQLLKLKELFPVEDPDEKIAS